MLFIVAENKKSILEMINRFDRDWETDLVIHELT